MHWDNMIWNSVKSKQLWKELTFTKRRNDHEKGNDEPSGDGEHI